MVHPLIRMFKRSPTSGVITQVPLGKKLESKGRFAVGKQASQQAVAKPVRFNVRRFLEMLRLIRSTK